MKRVLLALCLALGALSMSVGGAWADQGGNGNGVGITTACAQHDANAGNSYAYGLQCATSHFTYSVTCSGSIATQTWTATGLLPLSAVYITWTSGPASGQTFFFGAADSGGNFSYSAPGIIIFPGSGYLSGTGADGQPVTSPTFTQVTCP
jgi:hypothetical protein